MGDGTFQQLLCRLVAEHDLRVCFRNNGLHLLLVDVHERLACALYIAHMRSDMLSGYVLCFGVKIKWSVSAELPADDQD